MKNTFLTSFILFSLSSFSQTIYTRPSSKDLIKWNDIIKDYDKDTTSRGLKTKNAKIILSFDEIEIIDGDTTKLYLNESPEMEEDSTSIDRRWYDANDIDGRECHVFLFYFPKSNEYGLRIVYTDTMSGMEFYMKPLRVDAIPYKKPD